MTSPISHLYWVSWLNKISMNDTTTATTNATTIYRGIATRPDELQGY